VESFFIKHGAEMWKQKQWRWLDFCGSRNTLKKKAGSASKLRSD